MTIWSAAIIADADDGNVNETPEWYDHTYEGNPNGEAFTIVRNTDQFGGLRFQNMTVPAGATINSADLRFYITGGGSVDATNSVVTIFADVGANRQDAISNTHRPPATNWTNSTASATHNGLHTTGYHTIDIASIIEELIALGGWASGDDVCFSLDTSTNGSDTYWSVSISDYDADTSAQLADLTIDYTEAGAGGGSHQLTLLGVG